MRKLRKLKCTLHSIAARILSDNKIFTDDVPKYNNYYGLLNTTCVKCQNKTIPIHI